MPPKKSKKPLTQQICDQLKEDVKKAKEHPENKVKNPQSIYSLKQDSKVLTKLLEECLNKFSPKQLKIVVNEKEVATSPKFWNWLSSHEIHLKNGKVLNKKTNIGKYLFVYFVISQSPSDHEEYKANRDEGQNQWGSIVKFTADSNLLYNGESIFIRAIESIPTVLVGPSSSSTTPLDYSFTVLTYNCLYTEYAKDTKPPKHSDWELETVSRTKNNSKPVRYENIGWGVRLHRLVKNIQKNGTPDILLLQETTPRMLKDIVEQFPSYEDQENCSRYGMGQNDDGFCWILYNKNRFTKTNKPINFLGEFRFVGAYLRDTFTNKTIFAASVHLPVSGKDVTPIRSFVANLTKKEYTVVMGGDFNLEDNVFKGALMSLTEEHATFYNDNPSPNKFDWIVGSKTLRSLKSYANPVVKDEGRWPNEKEGSDHTALWTRLTMTPSTGTIGSEQIMFEGFTFKMLAPAAKMNHKPIDPIYICRAAQISSKQAWAIPTMLVTERTWNVISKPQMTHIGAFGDDYEKIGAIGNDHCVIYWKFPGDMFLWPLKWNKHLLQLPLPVGEYFMNNDEWSKIRVENIDPLPLDEPMLKMRVNNQSVGMHYLQKTDGGDETKVVMLGFQYFVSDLWEEDNEGQSKTGAMLTKLKEEQKITGFANHTQHHAIVMYSYEDESGKKRILSPVTWQILLKKTERFDAILNTLLSGSPKHMHEDLTRLIEAWRDCDLTEAPFLP